MKIHVVGIDMSSAFDTIYRDKLISIAESFMDEDDVRIIRKLLSNTTLEVMVEGAETTKFRSNIGSPQGGSISGPLFEIYFENALKEVRGDVDQFKQTNKQTENTSLPDEMIYADDCDFITRSKDTKRYINNNVDKTLTKHNLLVNTTKTENTTLERQPGKNGREKEEWRMVKKLGSLLGDQEDIANRKQLASGSMNKLKKLWKKRKVGINRKIKLYNSLVRSVLTYNSSTWGVSISDENNLDSFHRRQLRETLNIRFPHKINSRALYKVTNTRFISVDITKARWKLLGHTLRMHKDTPARKAMKFFFQEENNGKYKGRKRSSIHSTINRDIMNTKKIHPQFDLQPLRTEIDLHNIRVKATNRALWRKRVNLVVNAAYSEKLKTI